MTGRDLYEKWSDLAGDLIEDGESWPRPDWWELLFEESRAWDDLAAFLDSTGAKR